MNAALRPPQAGRRGLPGLDLAPLAAALMVFLLLGLIVKVVGPVKETKPLSASPAANGTTGLGSALQHGGAGVGDKVIAVDKAGRIFFDGREVVAEELALELHHLAGAGVQAVRIAADAQARFGAVTAVVDLCGEAGLGISDMAEVN